MRYISLCLAFLRISEIIDSIDWSSWIANDVNSSETSSGKETERKEKWKEGWNRGEQREYINLTVKFGIHSGIGLVLFFFFKLVPVVNFKLPM